MKLTDDEQAMFNGDKGKAKQKAMDLLVRYGEALGHFTSADLRSPRTLLRIAEVHEAMGNAVRAKDYRERVAHFNENNFEFALVRATLPK